VLSQGYVEVPWNTESDGNTLKSKPNCTTKNTVIGCWTNSYYGGPPDADFVFDTTAWTSPMRLQLTTDFIADAASNYVVWEVVEAAPAAAVWADDKSPKSQIVTRGSSLYVGGYATAADGKHSLTLTLKPKGLVDSSGNAVVCRKVGQVPYCRSFDRAEAIESISVSGSSATFTTVESHELVAGDQVKISGAIAAANNGTFTITRAADRTFTVTNARAVAQDAPAGEVRMAVEPAPNLGVDVAVTVAATVTLANVGAKPTATPSIECSANVKTVNAQNLEVACTKSGDPFTYGGSWSVLIKN
jgi:hypothetical protein